MISQRPTIVLFDMDGTTVRHINPYILGLLEHIDDIIYRVSAWFHSRKPHPDFKIDQTHKPYLLVHRALHSIRRSPVEQIVQPCPGIFTLLNMIHEAGIPIGIVSNGLGKGYGHDILTKFDLSHFFKAQIFREDIQFSKPHPDPLLRALKQLKDPLSENDVIWYIGDRDKDVTAALAANDILPARVIPFAYGIKAAVVLLKKGQNPEQIIANYTEFAGRIYSLMQKKAEEPSSPSSPSP